MAEEDRKEEKAEEEPEVYTVKKEIDGWKFNRRTFLAAASATAAAAALGTVTSCDSSEPALVTVVVTATPEGQVAEAPKPTEAGAQAPASSAAPKPTETPVPTATKTPTPSKTPTPTRTPTATHTPTPAVPKAKFVKDVTIPDGTVMKPAQKFTKTWRFQNSGAVSWGKGVQLVFVSGKQKGFESHKMAGPDAVDVPEVAPGKNIDVSVDLAAPEKLGKYRSYWRLKLGNGQWLENIHYAEIFVASDKALAEIVNPGDKGIEFKVKVEGKWVTWTQPCGMPIPPGAVCICNCVAVELPGQPGNPPAGQEGGTITGPGGETRWLPCGSPIPPGWTCICNCVTTPCGCHGVCDCVGQSCSCDAVHYWYPC